MGWRLAKALEKLREQVNARWPSRDKSWDGTIGDAAHASRSSDHNPWVQDGGTGVVTAMDITHDPAHGFDSYAFAEALRKTHDPRIKYIISNRRIANQSPVTKGGVRYGAWDWSPYSGSNPHDHHVHISVEPSKALYDSTAPWMIGELPAVIVSGTPSKPKRLLVKLHSSGADVSYLQRMLGVADTGEFDEATELAVIEFQKRYGLVPDGKVGVYTWRQLEA